MEKARKIHFMLEMSAAIGLALLFAFLPIRRWVLIPASLPLYYYSYQRGGKAGMLAGFLFALLTIPRALCDLPHWIVLPENLLEYTIVGMAGFFPLREQKEPESPIFRFWLWLYDCRGIILTSLLRFAVVVTGSTVFYTYYLKPPGQSALYYALLTEGKVLLPGLIIFMLVIPFLLRYKMKLQVT